jgi:hypothetical protein
MLLPVYHITCAGCGREFDWSPKQISETPPNYHSRACKERKRKRFLAQMPTKCPHPQKRVYVTHQLAVKACNDMQDIYMKPYRCRCGAYHIGHVQMYVKDWIEA